MTTTDRKHTRTSSHVEEHHVTDYLRVLYKRRWLAVPAFLIVFVVGAVNALRETPVYEARVQLLIERDTPNVATIDQMFQSQDGWFNDEFNQTQHRILQSRTLAKRTIDSMGLWEVERLGNGPVPKGSLSPTALLWGGVDRLVALARMPFAKPEPAPAPTPARREETAAQSSRIDEFLGGLGVVPVRNSRLVEVRYSSTDPEFAAQAANAHAKAYIQQNLEFRFATSKQAGDFLAEQLAEQRREVEASESRLQAYREKNGTVAMGDAGSSNIVIQQLTDLNAAVTRAKTERISKEALFNQLKSIERTGAIDSLPAVMSNDYIQKIKAELADLQRQQAQMAERYGERHAEMIKVRSAIESAETKLRAEIGRIVESVSAEYQAALAQERSMQSTLDGQRSAALGLNRRGVELSVLQREAESARQIYETLLQRTKETGISSERRTTNVRIVDEAEVPRGPVSPNVRRELMISLLTSLALAIGLAFVVDRFDNRVKTPQELKACIDVPFLGMVPMLGRDKTRPNPLLNNGVPPNFAEAFKTVRTNVLFSSADEGMRSIVVTSAGPGEGKSVIASNMAMALAQAGQRVLLIDADMRRPRVHEIFDTHQEPGLSNVLTGNGKASEAIQKSSVHGLWLLPSGHIPPNPAELLGSRRYADFVASLSDHFDWVVIDSPPVLVVADGSIVAHKASGVVFVVGADHTNRQAVQAAIEQLESADAHVIGSVLNRVDLVRNPYYYSAYYRKDYARYYVKAH